MKSVSPLIAAVILISFTIAVYCNYCSLIDKVIVCSIACPGICKELPSAQC